MVKKMTADYYVYCFLFTFSVVAKFVLHFAGR